MNQLVFSLPEAIAQKDQGIRQVAQNNQHFLEVARDLARKLARLYGEITADDVRKQMSLEPLHYNSWGAVFQGKEWLWTGRFRRSELVQGHGNLQRVWRLKQ